MMKSLTMVSALTVLALPVAALAQISGGAGLGTGGGLGSNVGVGSRGVPGTGPAAGLGGSARAGINGGIGTASGGTGGRAGLNLPSLVPVQGPARTGLLGGETYERPGIAGRPRPSGSLFLSGSSGSTPYEDRLAEAGEAAQRQPGDVTAGTTASGEGGATAGGATDSTSATTQGSIQTITPD